MSDEFKLQWSVSLAPVAQYAKGHMFNFRGNTVEELNSLFDEVLGSETVQKALDVAALLTAADVVTTATKGAGQESQGESNVTALKTCAHGVRERREGTNSRGKWVGYMCPQPKGAKDKCDPIWE